MCLIIISMSAELKPQNLFEELTFGKGYEIIQLEEMNVMEELRNSFINKINEILKVEDDINAIRKKLATLSKAEINKAMIGLLSFSDLSEMMIKTCPKLIKSLCGVELFIQRRAHTIINLPGKGQAKQWAHYELMSGISPFSFVMWAPLHDLDDNGGVYYIDQKESSKIMREEEDEGLVNGPRVLGMMTNQIPAKMKYGEAILFNPFVLHGSIEFESNMARVACNVRFQSTKKPLLQKNTDYLKFFSLN